MTASFRPPVRILMGPGPSDVNPRILEALSKPTIGHLDPAFIGLMDDMKRLLRRAFRTDNSLTLPISAPGSAGMECCFVNLVSPGDKVIIAQNGVFGGRMRENVERCGGTAVMVQDDWGKPVDPQKIDEVLSAHRDAKALAFVHAETSTGARSDAATLCRLAGQRGLLTIVDTVTGLGGIDVNVDAWEADAVYSGTQKCLSCPPGLSPVTFSTRAKEAIKKRAHKVQSWFLDMGLVMTYWEGGQRAYHHTAPVNMLYGLHESLVILEEEGLENSWARHAFNHQALAAGLRALGIDFVVDEAHRLPQLNCVVIPAGVDDAQVRRQLLQDFNLEIGAGLGPLAGKVWRIGLMGYASSRANVLFCLGALEAILKRSGGVRAAEQHYGDC